MKVPDRSVHCYRLRHEKYVKVCPPKPSYRILLFTEFRYNFPLNRSDLVQNIFPLCLRAGGKSLVPRKGKPVKMAHGVKSQLTLVTLHICRFRSLKNDSCRLTIDMENKNKNQWYIAQHCFPIIFALALKLANFFFFYRDRVLA